MVYDFSKLTDKQQIILMDVAIAGDALCIARAYHDLGNMQKSDEYILKMSERATEVITNHSVEVLADFAKAMK